uniref:homeodomain-interacting protein kinase 2-like n=1 Tax=Maylandia zebra TaxID=106582 RepID=UPI000D320259|nr:homeodomain-interacting protein kinase 2-like [Maylandia zebra]
MTNRAVAIKVNKSRPDILQQAKLEIFILEQLRRLDSDAANIVQWDGFFHDGERVCLKFELLYQCLRDYIWDRKNHCLPISEVRPILGQITNALSHLSSVGMVHADLKPGNIMVCGTVGYCAPEVMLGLPYNEAIDMWSLGLVAVELATGLPLYPGNEDYDVLKFIIETQGQPPDHVLDSGVYTEDYFIEDKDKQQRWTFKTDQQFQYETGYESLETRCIKLTRLDDLEQIIMFRRGPEAGQRLFVSLIKQMLALDAHQRITPSEVLRHPFFSPKSSLCIDMSAEISQNPVVFQHPSNLESKRSQKINCSFQNSVEFSQQVFVHTSASPSFSSDELELVKGSILGKHYKVEAFLGEGGFGIVAKCRDTTTNQAVAIKVNKSDPDILQQAHVEIFILEQLRRLDPDAANIVQWNGFFHDGQRVCLKFELLDQCLWDYIGDRNKQGLPISEVRPILGQITNALSHLSSVGIVHADLKPGNIMVVNRHESPIKVKLIDFGLACPASAVIPGDFVGTVGYCAPEVMLGLPYNEASDMWSLGLVAVELATGLTVHRLGARTLIRSLEMKERELRGQQDGGVKEKVVQLSVQSGVSSSFTTFIAVNKDNREAIQGPLHRRHILPPCEFGKFPMQVRNAVTDRLPLLHLGPMPNTE